MTRFGGSGRRLVETPAIASCAPERVDAAVINLQRHPPCPLWLFTASWELTDAGLTFTNALLDGESFPELDVWMSQKPWTKLD
jgi:hypothetical protein